MRTAAQRLAPNCLAARPQSRTCSMRNLAPWARMLWGAFGLYGGYTRAMSSCTRSRLTSPDDFVLDGKTYVLRK